MAKNYPETVPANFAANPALEDAYRHGWNHGHGFACHNVPTIGETYWTDCNGKVRCDSDNVREVHSDLCFAAESNSRSFSPFEFTAHEFNSAGYEGDGEEHDDDAPLADALWEAFDAGVNDAIFADLAEYTDEDYGIESEPNEGDTSKPSGFLATITIIA